MSGEHVIPAGRSRPSADMAARRMFLAAWWTLCGAIAAAAAWFYITKVVNHDVAYWLDAAGRLIDGAELYRDLIELNPPLNYLLSMLPVAAARLAGFDAIVTFHVLVVVEALACIGFIVAIARRIFAAHALLAQLLTLPAVFALLVIPGPDFGQREHLLTILLMPYLLIASAGAATPLPPGFRIAAGLMAGLGMAFKPYFLLYAVAVEAVVLLRSRNLRAVARVEVLLAAGVNAAMAIVTVICFPAYITFIIPLGREIYQGFEATPEHALLQPHVCGSVLILGIAALLMARAPLMPDVKRYMAVLAAAVAAGLVVYVIQMKGWRYQALPAVMLSVMALGTVVATRAEAALFTLAGRAGPALRRGGRAVLVVGLAALAAGGPAVLLLRGWIVDDQQHAARIRPLIELVRREAIGEPVLFLSSHLSDTFPVVNYARVPWPYSYHHLLPLPGLYRGYDPKTAGRPFRAPAEMGATEARFFTTVIEDTLRHPPRLILVDRRKQIPPLTEIGFDFMAYFRQNPRFDRLFSAYHRLTSVGGYEVFRRTD